MASNSRYTARDLEGDPEHDEHEYEDDSDYIVNAEESEGDVEQRGRGNEGEGSDEENDEEEGDDPEDQQARVITLDELREWTNVGKFLAVESDVDLNELRHNSTTCKPC